MRTNRLVSRREIAVLAGIDKSLLSTWKSRHASFPRPRSSEEGDLFVLAEMIGWMTDRTIPDRQLLPTETKGCTYADRVIRNSSRRDAGSYERSVAGDGSGRQSSSQADVLAELYGPLAKRVCGSGPQMDYLQLLLCLVFVRVVAAEQWARITDLVNEAGKDLRSPAELLDALGAIVDTVLREHGVLPGIRTVFTRLQPASVEDLAQVQRTCHDLGRDSFQVILDRFADWGQRDSSEFFTPSGIVGLATEILLGEVAGPVRCHDPYLRFGEFLAAAASTVPGVETSGFGRHPEQLRLAAMNIAIHGAGVAELLPGDVLTSGKAANPAPIFDFVLTNPPFNQKNSAEWHVPGEEWPFAAPPAKNGNFAWLQHVYASLKVGGRACVVMPNQAAASDNKAETEIRQAMVGAGAVECVVALPPGLFATTPVPVCVWFLVKTEEIPDSVDLTDTDAAVETNARDSVLLIDARAAGEKKAGRRHLTEQDMQSIVDCYREWRSDPPKFRPKDLGHGGIAVAASITDIERRDYSLSPADYRPIPGASAAKNAKPLGALCEIQAGPSNALIKDIEYVDDGVAMIAPAQLRHRGIRDEHAKRVRPDDARRLAKFELEDGDILCARTGTLGPCALADHAAKGMLFGTGLLRLRTKELARVDPRYLIAFLSLPSTVTWIENKAAGTTIPSISSANLGKLLVPLPSLDVQRRIGAEVAAADARIVALHKQMQTAEVERISSVTALFANPPASLDDGDHAARDDTTQIHAEARCAP
ncbi:type I restriction-modification system subunit M/S [Nocardia fluminea]|uniref:type I restriction-modification system subunit M/S n=1 Tax=Nocardia fluminea TaxID=134984 RepID=UPI0034088B66